MTVVEPKKELPVAGSYDVVVCGGGIAGVSAALAAARTGAKTLLLERAFGLGGLATLGLIVVYLPLCDGKGTQVCHGLSEELLKLSIKHGYEGRYPDAWLETGKESERKKQRYEVQYNGNVCAILFEQKLVEEGVDILYGTSVCDLIKSGDKIEYAIIENKSGRQAIYGKTFVDTTGDADLFKMADEETVIHESGNPLAAWYLETSGGEYRLKVHGVSDMVRPGEEAERISNKRYIGIEGKELSDMVIDSHKSTLDDFLKGGEDSCSHALSTIAAIPMIRMTRRIRGICEMKESDAFVKLEDSVGLVSNWKYAGPVYEVPFSALHGKVCTNLIAAGRMVAADDEMWDVMRVIPPCAVTGEAAGTAAALFEDFTKADISLIQQKLKQNGVILHADELEYCTL